MKIIRSLALMGRSKFKAMAAAAAMMTLSGAAFAAPVLQGRLADNTASATCTSNGSGGTTKCTSFYLSDPIDSGFQGFTILNNWNIGTGVRSATAATGSAQYLAEKAGLDATGLDGWLLPTGAGDQTAGALNQYLFIWQAVGGTLTDLRDQFDGVTNSAYWSGTPYPGGPNDAWLFFPSNGRQHFVPQISKLSAVAVRPGDVAAAVPEPQTLALALLALGTTVAARGSRPA